MIIGFDAKRAFYNQRGLGNYSRSIIKGLCEHHRENDYHCYSPRTNSPLLPEAQEIGAITTHLSRHTFQSLWRSFGMSHDLKRDNINLFHGLSNELPYTPSSFKTKFVVSIHDLLFKRQKEDYPILDRQIYQIKVRHALKKADMIISVSKNTKIDLLESYQLNEDQVTVLPPICDNIFFQECESNEIGALKERMKLPCDFLLFVGALTINKNVITLVETLQLLPNHSLVIVGRGPMRAQLNRYLGKHKLHDRVHFVCDVNPISQQYLACLYQMASLTIVPSFYEGFGLPIIESLASKTPVICSNTSAMPETCGPGGLTFDPEDFESLANSISTLSSDSEQYRQYTHSGYKHAQKFQSKFLCQGLISIYSELVN